MQVNCFLETKLTGASFHMSRLKGDKKLAYLRASFAWAFHHKVLLQLNFTVCLMQACGTCRTGMKGFVKNATEKHLYTYGKNKLLKSCITLVEALGLVGYKFIVCLSTVTFA